MIGSTPLSRSRSTAAKHRQANKRLSLRLPEDTTNLWDQQKKEDQEDDNWQDNRTRRKRNTPDGKEKKTKLAGNDNTNALAAI